MTQRKEKWFKPTRHSGFQKTKTVKANISTMMSSLPKSWSKCKKLDRVRRQAQALSNVTRDRETKSKAKSTAVEAGRRYHSTNCKITRRR